MTLEPAAGPSSSGLMDPRSWPDSDAGQVPPPARQPLPPLPLPSVVATSDAVTATENITCPECGTTSRVTLNHRDAADFCRSCDFPLFWVPARVLLGRDDGSEASLRRLPGTVGRATIASLACPHCSEPNAVTAETCIRCGQSMHPIAAPPPPAPVYVAPEPLPEPYVEPDRRWPWWAWALIILAGAAAVALVTYLILSHIV